jgi:hypothetical protein
MQSRSEPADEAACGTSGPTAISGCGHGDPLPCIEVVQPRTADKVCYRPGCGRPARTPFAFLVPPTYRRYLLMRFVVAASQSAIGSGSVRPAYLAWVSSLRV